MSASKPATPIFSPDAYGDTDFAKMDAHVITPEEYEELPELTEADLEGGQQDRGADEQLIRGQPGSVPKG